jgi:hypothetical protein
MDVRTRRWAIPLLAAALTVLAIYAMAWVSTPTAQTLRADFVNAYMGAQLLRSGHGAQLYDLSVQAPLYAALTSPYRYPLLAFYDTPSAAALAAPFTLVGVATAWRIFSLVQLACLVTAAVIAARSAPWPARTSPVVRGTIVAVALAGFSTNVLFLQGQWSGLFALGVALGYRQLRRGHTVSAAVCLLAPVFAVKPNLGLALTVFVIAWGGRRAALGAAAAGAAVLLVSLAVGGPSVVGAFLHAAIGSRSFWPLVTMDGITGITGSLLGSGGTADMIGFAACALAAAAALPLGRLARTPGNLEPALAAAVALTLLASPHLYPHDLAMLTPAAVWVMAWAHQRDHEASATTVRLALAMALLAWFVFNVLSGIDERAASAKLVPWCLLAGSVALTAAAGAFGRRRLGTLSGVVTIRAG